MEDVLGGIIGCVVGSVPAGIVTGIWEIFDPAMKTVVVTVKNEDEDESRDESAWGPAETRVDGAGNLQPVVECGMPVNYAPRLEGIRY